MNKIKDVVLALQHLLGNLCSLLQQFLQLWLWDLCVAAPEDPNLGVLVHRTTFPKVIKTFPQQGQRFPCTAPGPHCFLWEAKGTHGTVDRGFSHLEFLYGCSHRCNLLSSLCLMNAGGAWLSCCSAGPALCREGEIRLFPCVHYSMAAVAAKQNTDLLQKQGG